MRAKTLIAVAACGLIMVSCGGRNAKKAAAEDTTHKKEVKVRIADSLNVVDSAGPAVTDHYEGILPGADGPGINYDLKLMHYEAIDDGVYELGMTYLKGKDGKDKTFRTYGRYATFIGIAGNEDAGYVRLVPFGKSNPEADFAIMTNGLMLLGEGLTLPVSEHNYTLVRKTAVR